MPPSMVVLGLGEKPKSRSAPPPPPFRKTQGDVSARNHAQETPAAEKEFHERGGSVTPTPESVGYRTGDQVCRNCEYMQQAQCAFLQMPVGEADSCARFEDRAEDAGQPGESYEEDQEIGEGA